MKITLCLRETCTHNLKKYLEWNRMKNQEINLKTKLLSQKFI